MRIPDFNGKVVDGSGDESIVATPHHHRHLWFELGILFALRRRRRAVVFSSGVCSWRGSGDGITPVPCHSSLQDRKGKNVSTVVCRVVTTTGRMKVALWVTGNAMKIS